MSNIQYFDQEAREKLKAGMYKVFRSVCGTYGANGKNSIYNKMSRIPVISNDGVTIARQVEPQDLAELQGANLFKQVLESTNEEVEDGSTATAILTYSMIEKGISLIDSNPKISPMKLRKQMKEATDKVIEELKSKSISISDISNLEELAITSVESEEYGKIIAQAIHDAGENGVVYVNESEKIGLSIEKVEGYQFQQGLITPYLVMNVDKMETELENVAVFVTDMLLSFTNEFSEMIKQIVSQGTKNILIICDEIHQDVIKFAVMNMAKGNFNMIIVKKPMQKDYLEDIAAIVGATAMTMNKGIVHPKIEYVGHCKKVIANEKTTTIFDGENEKIGEYVDSLKSQIEVSESEITKTKIQERIARLTGGIYLLNVGEKTEAQVKYLRDKVDDALNSLKKVWKEKKEGIVAGGGSTLYHIGKRLLSESDLNDGEKIIYESCCAPLMQMLKNGGDEELLSEISGTDSAGYNALTMAVESDMFKAGIIDATKVIMTSLSNSSDFAGLLLTVDNTSVPLPENKVDYSHN